MNEPTDIPGRDTEEIESREWLDSLEQVLRYGNPPRVQRLLSRLQARAARAGVGVPGGGTTPYLNTIPRAAEPPYPGNLELERRIASLVRWNAMAMVVRANRAHHGLGGHIATFASAATLLEVGFNHFFRGGAEAHGDDLIYFQGHASPGIYARAWMLGRLPEEWLVNFRRERAKGGGLSSYPHPRLMPEFWEFPTVSMGLGPIMAIYQARFNRYLEDRGLKDATGKVWAFLGDGETDEPEALGSISLAGREKLDNLVFVVNCNLQRLDGPVRGNGKIVQELESFFRGAGWNVIKVLWGGGWDPLLEADAEGVLAEHLGAAVDGEFQRYSAETGGYFREKFFGKDPRLARMVEHLTDDGLKGLERGGHDSTKVYAAYQAAVTHKGQPTVILAHTVKGYGMGEAGEGKNIAHQQKELGEDDLLRFARRFEIPIPESRLAEAPFYRPPEESPEMMYMRSRRLALGGYVPRRSVAVCSGPLPADDVFAEFMSGSDGREASTTMAFVRLLSKLMRDRDFGRFVVPIVPDEARTFGMEAMFRQAGIYSHVGQKYEPVDHENLLYYREARDGQVLEEGITEAGSMASFMAAGAAYATRGVSTIPFYIYYSMFGLQRVGDLVWAAADLRTRGFLLGATAGRTTLMGEGLQHQDGHSHLLAYPAPSLLAYDPAYAYEVATIIKEGLRRMHTEGEGIFYYLTLYNEPYAQPAMPAGATEGILRGMYRLRPAGVAGGSLVRLLGSGPILNCVLRAADLIEGKFGVGAEVWSVTSYKALHRDAVEADRWNVLNPAGEARTPYFTGCLAGGPGVVVAASDYMKAVPLSLARWSPQPMTALGTDGFGRSETREALRDFFEVDEKHIVAAALGSLARAGLLAPEKAAAGIREMGVDPTRPDPWNE